MLYLFDRCYRKGDPKMMHVRFSPVSAVGGFDDLA